MAFGHGTPYLAALDPYAITSSQIFSLPAEPDSVNKYILPSWTTELIECGIFSFIIRKKKKMKRRATINPGLEYLPEEPVVMESYKAGTSRERERAWETETEN